MIKLKKKCSLDLTHVEFTLSYFDKGKSQMACVQAVLCDFVMLQVLVKVNNTV